MCNNDVKVSLVQLSYAKAVELCDEGRLVPFLCCLLNDASRYQFPVGRARGRHQNSGPNIDFNSINDNRS